MVIAVITKVLPSPDADTDPETVRERNRLRDKDRERKRERGATTPKRTRMTCSKIMHILQESTSKPKGANDNINNKSSED